MLKSTHGWSEAFGNQRQPNLPTWLQLWLTNQPIKTWHERKHNTPANATFFKCHFGKKKKKNDGRKWWRWNLMFVRQRFTHIYQTRKKRSCRFIKISYTWCWHIYIWISSQLQVWVLICICKYSRNLVCRNVWQCEPITTDTRHKEYDLLINENHLCHMIHIFTCDQNVNLICALFTAQKL